jgi:hypothetical protein
MNYFFNVDLTNFGTTLSKQFHCHNIKAEAPKVRPVAVIPFLAAKG